MRRLECRRLLLAPPLHRGRNAHRFAVLGDRAARNVDTGRAQFIDNGIVREHLGGGLSVDQLAAGMLIIGVAAAVFKSRVAAWGSAASSGHRFTRSAAAIIGGVLSSLSRYSALLLLVLAALGAAAQMRPANPSAQTLLVLPFENESKAPGLEWISESFPEVLGQRLASPLLYIAWVRESKDLKDLHSSSRCKIGIDMNLSEFQ